MRRALAAEDHPSSLGGAPWGRELLHPRWGSFSRNLHDGEHHSHASLGRLHPQQGGSSTSLAHGAAAAAPFDPALGGAQLPVVSAPPPVPSRLASVPAVSFADGNGLAALALAGLQTAFAEGPATFGSAASSPIPVTSAHEGTSSHPIAGSMESHPIRVGSLFLGSSVGSFVLRPNDDE